MTFWAKCIDDCRSPLQSHPPGRYCKPPLRGGASRTRVTGFFTPPCSTLTHPSRPEIMDDQGAGGSSRNHDRNPERRLMRESSLPPTLRPHLYHAPRHISSQGIAPLIVPDWPNQPTRSRSQDYGRSLPSPSHLLSQIPAQDHRMALEQGDVKGLQRDPRPQVGPFPSQSIRGM